MLLPPVTILTVDRAVMQHSKRMPSVPSGGFNGAVALSLSGQPAGSSVTFTPVSPTRLSTLTLMTGSKISRGTYTLTSRGVSGSLSHTTAASLTVTR